MRWRTHAKQHRNRCFLVSHEADCLFHRETSPILLCSREHPCGDPVVNPAPTSGLLWTGVPQVAYAAILASVIQLSRAVTMQYSAKGIAKASQLTGIGTMQGIRTLLMACLTALASAALAQAAAPVKLVITFPPGGPVDFVARVLADVRTLDEQGIHGVESNNWYALFAPARTPPARIGELNAAVRRVLTSERYRQRLLDSGADPMPTTPDQLAALVKADTVKWGWIIRDKKIKGE